MVHLESTQLDSTILSRPSKQAIAEWDRAIYISELQNHLVSSETPMEIRHASCLVNCPIYVNSERRGAILQNIFDSGFDVGVSLYPNVHELPGFNQIPGRSKNVTRLVRSVISLPTHPRISQLISTLRMTWAAALVCPELRMPRSSSLSFMKLLPKPMSEWGVQLVGDRSEIKALTVYRQLQKKHEAILGSDEPIIIRTTVKVSAAPIWSRVRIGADSREAAQTLCSRLRAVGENCLVQHN
jgi:SPOR domain